MTTADILAALPRLTLDELAQVQMRLNALADAPRPAAASPTPAARAVPATALPAHADHGKLDETHDTYDVSPDGGSTWDAAKAAGPAKRTEK